MTEVVSPEQRAEIVNPPHELMQVASTYQVTDAPSFERAGSQLKFVKAAQKKLAEQKKGVLDPANEVVRRIRQLFAEPEADLVAAENYYKRGMIAYSDEQERLRRDEQRKLDEEAAKRQRVLEEQAQNAAAAAERERAAGNVKAAEKLEHKAEMRADQAATVVAPIVQREAPKVSGIAERENWSAVVVDFPALVAAVAAGQVPITALEPNMKFLNNQAKAMKRELAYTGVRPVRETIIAAGSR